MSWIISLFSALSRQGTQEPDLLAGGETKAGAQEAGPVAHYYCPAGHGFWTKEFILIELIALELDWFQLCRTHTSDHLPAVKEVLQRRYLLAKKDRKRRLGRLLVRVRKCKTISAPRFYL